MPSFNHNRIKQQTLDSTRALRPVLEWRKSNFGHTYASGDEAPVAVLYLGRFLVAVANEPDLLTNLAPTLEELQRELQHVLTIEQAHYSAFDRDPPAATPPARYWVFDTRSGVHQEPYSAEAIRRMAPLHFGVQVMKVEAETTWTPVKDHPDFQEEGA